MFGAVAPGQEQLEQPVTLPGQVTRRLAQADARADAHQLLAVHVARHTDADRQFHAPRPHPAGPVRDHPGIEADLADDVGGVGSLFAHGLDRHLVADLRVALRVAGDAHLVEIVPDLRHRCEQSGCVLELPGVLIDVAGDHEGVSYSGLAQPLQDLTQFRPVPNEPRREVGRHAVAVPGQPFGEFYRGPGSLTRRDRNRERYVLRDVLDDRLLRPREGYNLVAGIPQKLSQPPVRPLRLFGVLLRRHVLPPQGLFALLRLPWTSWWRPGSAPPSPV